MGHSDPWSSWICNIKHRKERGGLQSKKKKVILGMLRTDFWEVQPYEAASPRLDSSRTEHTRTASMHWMPSVRTVLAYATHTSTHGCRCHWEKIHLSERSKVSKRVCQKHDLERCRLVQEKHKAVVGWEGGKAMQSWGTGHYPEGRRELLWSCSSMCCFQWEWPSRLIDWHA